MVQLLLYAGANVKATTRMAATRHCTWPATAGMPTMEAVLKGAPMRLYDTRHARP